MSAEPERNSDDQADPGVGSGRPRRPLALDSGEHLGVDPLDTANEQSMLDRGNRSRHAPPPRCAPYRRIEARSSTTRHYSSTKTAIPQRRTHLIQSLDSANGRVARQPEHHTCATSSRSPSTNSISPTTAHPIRAGSAIRASVPHLGLLFLNSSETSTGNGKLTFRHTQAPTEESEEPDNSSVVYDWLRASATAAARWAWRSRWVVRSTRTSTTSMPATVRSTAARSSSCVSTRL
jgi:hypothetical protein